MGAGVDPHTHIPSLPDSAKLEEADAVFYCGLHLEGKMQDGLERMAERVAHVFALTDGIDLLPFLATARLRHWRPCQMVG